MKKLLLILAALVAIALPKAVHALDVEGMYAGGIGGINWLNYDRDHVKLDFKVGWLAGGAVGYRWCNGFRGEIEAVYRYNRTRWFKVHEHEKVHVGGHLRTWSFMANGYYELNFFNNCCCTFITPYVGAGIGYDTTKLEACKRFHHTNKTESGFAWQVMLGALYPIDECLEMGVEYRFHHGKEKNLYNNSLDVRLNMFF